MGKKIVAMLVALAVSGFGSLAFAAHEIADIDKPVAPGAIEIYGRGGVSVDMIDTGGKEPADTRLSRVSSNSSRFGFKGSWDLGDGLTAVYQVELGVNMDGTTSTVATGVTNTTTGAVSTTSVNTLSLRNTYVGLKGKSWGTLLVGTHDTPYKTSTGKFDPFFETMGDYNAIIANVNGDANFDLRPKDVIAYATPSWGGVQISAAASLTGSETDNGAISNASLYSASAIYSAGPLGVALAHEIHKNGAAVWDAGTTITGTKLGAGYTFGGTSVGLIYEALKDDKANSQFTRNAVYAALSQKIGRETIKLAYGKADDGDNPATKTGATLIAAGIEHALAKRTALFAVYAMTDNDENATYGLGQSGAGGAFKPGAGEDPSALSIGIRHDF